MGSWDACCGLSKLSINVGDPVVDFLIAEVGSQRDRGFICYSNDLWSPLFVQSYGNYADYGVIEVEASWHTSYIERILRELVIELPLGENEHHDIEVTRDKITYDFAQNAIHEGRLMIPAPRGSSVVPRPASRSAE